MKPMLKQIFKPDMILNSLSDLSAEDFKKYAIKTLILDVDNTLIAKEFLALNEGILDSIKYFKTIGIKIVLVTNNSGIRRIKLANKLDLKLLTTALKPFTFRFKQFKLKQHLEEPMMMVGDQLFTDIIFAKRIKAVSVLVNPLSEKEYISTKILRTLERKLVDRS